MDINQKWPDDIRLKMIEKSQFYEDPEIYQYGYYDGYQLQNEKIEQLQKELEKVNGEFDNFVDWLDSRDSSKNIYREYLDIAVPPLILTRK